jgi:hypothetical protein
LPQNTITNAYQLQYLAGNIHTMGLRVSILYLLLALVVVTLTGWPIRAWRGAHDNGVDTLFQAAITGAVVHGGIAVALAAIGVFSLPLQLGITSVIVVLVIVRCRQQHISMRIPIIPTNERMPVMVAAGVLLVAIILSGTPSEVILGGRDAGIYANTGIMIARTGSIRQYDPLVADLAQRRNQESDAAQGWSNLLGVQSGMRFMSSRMRLAGLFISESNAINGEYTPQFLHLFPAWIAIFASLFGIQYALLATGFAGVLGIWSVGMAGRAMHSPWLGVIAMVLLTLNSVQIWFSRYPMSETTAQWLIFVVIYGMARIAQRPQPHDATYAALLAGAAAGQLILTRLDFVFVVAPLIAWMLWRWVTQRFDSPLRWLMGGLVICGIHGVVHLLTISKNYFIDTFFALFQKSALTALAIFPFLTPTLQRVFLVRPCSPLTMQPCPGESIADAPWRYGRIGVEFVALIGIVALIWVIRTRTTVPTRILAWLTPWYQSALRVAAIASLVIVAYAYVIRPQILTPTVIADAPACLSATQRSTPTDSCLVLQGYIGAPIAPPMHADIISQELSRILQLLRGQDQTVEPLRDMYANSMANLVRIGWYISPIGILASAIGLALWLWHGLTRRDWFFMVVTLATAIVFIQLSYGTSAQTYIYIMRRYLPTIYPGLALLSAYAIVVIWNTQWWRRLISGGTTAVLVLFLIATMRPVLQIPEYAGAISQVATIAATSTQRDVVLIRGGAPSYVMARDASDVIALPLAAIHGREVFSVRSQYPDNYARDLATLYQRWMNQDRRIFFLLGANGALWIPGMSFVKQEPITFVVPEFSQLLNQKPASVGQLAVTYQRYELVRGDAPLATRIDVSDTASQVGGFYTQETIKGRTFAWTTGRAVLRFDAPPAPRPLTLRVSAGSRPALLGAAKVCIDVAAQVIPQTDANTTWQELDCMDLVSTAIQTISVTVPVIDTSASNATGAILVKLRSVPWVMAEVDPLQHDRRPLGIQFLGADFASP